MTGQTGRTRVGIPRNALVVIIGPRIGMANGTTEYRIISRCGVTVRTLVPFPFMLTGIYRKIHPVVVKVGRLPGRFRMAIRASSREAGSRVFGVGRLVIIGLVAADAGGGRRRIIVPVQVASIAGSRFMGAVQGIYRVVVKSRRHPGGFAVTGFTIGWEIRRFVVRIGGLVVIADMAAGAGVGRVVVVSLVAAGAIVGHGRMRAVQGVVVVVNRKRGRLPGIGRMAGGAILRDR